MSALLKYGLVLASGLAIGSTVNNSGRLDQVAGFAQLDRLPGLLDDAVARLRPEAPRPAFDPAVAGRVDEELDYWVAKRIGTVEGWQAFLASHAGGAHVEAARAEFDRLSHPGAASVPAAALAATGAFHGLQASQGSQAGSEPAGPASATGASPESLAASEPARPASPAPAAVLAAGPACDPGASCRAAARGADGDRAVAGDAATADGGPRAASLAEPPPAAAPPRARAKFVRDWRPKAPAAPARRETALSSHVVRDWRRRRRRLARRDGPLLARRPDAARARLPIRIRMPLEARDPAADPPGDPRREAQTPRQGYGDGGRRRDADRPRAAVTRRRGG